jgi:hypothetical protein
MEEKVTIRAGQYQGAQGFHIRSGPQSNLYCFGVFVETRRAAEMCKTARLAGQKITLDHLLGIEPTFWDSEAY